VDYGLREGVHISQCCAHTSKCLGRIMMCVCVCVLRVEILCDYWAGESGRK
jgi:hypothetical protein